MCMVSIKYIRLGWWGFEVWDLGLDCLGDKVVNGFFLLNFRKSVMDLRFGYDFFYWSVEICIGDIGCFFFKLIIF